MILILSLAFCLAACGRDVEAQAAATYSDARAKLNHGDLVAAREDVDSVLRRSFPPSSDWPARFNVLKAEILMHQGLYKDSFALLDPPLPDSLSASESAVRRLYIQAFDASGLGRFPEADAFAASAERLAQAGQPQLLAQVAIVEGSIDFRRSNWTAAEARYREALQFARQQKDPYVLVAALGSMGLISIRQDRYDEAADWNAQALQLAQSIGAADSVGRILGNLAWSYSQMGDFEKALLYHQQAEQAAARSGILNDRVLWLNGIAVDYFLMHDFSRAEATWRRTLDLSRSLDDKPAIAQALNNLTYLALENGRIDEAESYARQAADVERQTTDPVSVVNTTQASARIEAARRNFADSRNLFEQVLHDPAAELSLRWSAESRLAQVYAEEGRPADAEEFFRRSIATIERVRSSVRREEFRITFLSDAIAFYNDFIDFLISRNRIADALQVAELSRARTLADGLGIASSELSFPIRNFQPSQTAAKLKSTILSYWLGSPHSYLWVVSPQHLDVFTLPAAPEIDSVVQSYRKALAGPLDPLDSRNQAGQLLFDMLIGQAGGKVPPHARVTILPDGSLYNLNFEALIASSPQPHYWIDDADIDYASSLVMLSASAREARKPKKNLLLIGAPVSPTGDFPDLPQATTEIGLVENHFPSADRLVIQRDSATPAAYLDNHPEKFSFIHFVAHGIASRIDPLDSAVILTRQGDAYKLYARDIVQHPIRADVVTVSACHGTGERTFSGEGLVGLNWAFLRAGARSVISALWEVDDTSTPQLMDHLYGEISKGVPPDSALRDAKLALLRSGTVYRKPFYWAPFQLYRGI